MSIQIRIAQSKQDEIDFARFLATLSLDLFQSRIFVSGGFHPSSFNPELGERLCIFRRADLEAVSRFVVPVMGKPSTEQLLPQDGLVIEWERTRAVSGQDFVPGRIYWPSPRVLTRLASDDARSLMLKITKFIKRNYPRRSGDKYPCFAGPLLSERIASGKSRLLYRGGSEMTLVQNP
jgi:hypothetical protein